MRLSDVIRVTKGIPVGIPDNLEFSGVSTDSRTIKEGEVFFALRGERFNGHKFVKEALKKGAPFSVVAERGIKRTVMVKDTLYALGEIALIYRQKFKIPFIAVTGSNGKTTTKELLATILSERYKVLKSKGGYNNFIGVPLTLFELDKSYDIAVLEFGMNRRGEIKRLSEIAGPETGIITNISPCHIAFFKDERDILQAKLEILPFIKTLIFNKDNHLLRCRGKQLFVPTIHTFGIESGEMRAEKLKLEETRSHFYINGLPFNLPIPGIHNVYNALAGILVGTLYGVSLKEAQRALANASLLKGRGAILNLNGFRIIDSTYNSNPVALLSSLEQLKLMKAKRKIAVLGDMLELGKKAEEYHRKIGKELKRFGVKELFTLGKLAENFGSEAGIDTFSFNSIEELIPCLKKYILPGDVILIKGSRKLKMERIVEEMKDEL
jgi:UDP-N-acetylmuramoyl-tripeptide--D-alanyl-D-alanine ligase